MSPVCRHSDQALDRMYATQDGWLCRFHFFAIIHNTFRVFLPGAVDAMPPDSRMSPDHFDHPDFMEPRPPGLVDHSEKSVYSYMNVTQHLLYGAEVSQP